MSDESHRPPEEDRRGSNEAMPSTGADLPLTRIRGAYTLAATNEPETSEIDRMTMKHFVETMAEVALSVASRRATRKQESA